MSIVLFPKDPTVATAITTEVPRGILKTLAYSPELTIPSGLSDQVYMFFEEFTVISPLFNIPCKSSVKESSSTNLSDLLILSPVTYQKNPSNAE